MLIFSEQDLIKDPPFSKIDLISCRNLLIYMGGDLQKTIISLFHYALNINGILFLGTSETIGDFNNLFSVLDRKSKLYQQKTDLHGTYRQIRRQFSPQMILKNTTQPEIGLNRADQVKLPLQKLTEQTLLRKVTPAAALVNNVGDILYLHGRTGMFLEPAPGESTINNILKMAREGLQQELTKVLHKSVRKKK